MMTREQEFSRIKELLDFPKEQRPSPHSIVSEMFRQEQYQNNVFALNKSNANLSSLTFNTANGVKDYQIAEDDVADFNLFGKPQNVWYEANGSIVPIEIVDYSDALFVQNQHSDIVLPYGNSGFPNYPFFSPYRISFRKVNAVGSATIARLTPTPTTVFTITVEYTLGANRRTDNNWQEIVAFPEVADLRHLKTVLQLLDKAEWRGMDDKQNQLKRQNMKARYQLEAMRLEKESRNVMTRTNNRVRRELHDWWE